MEQGKLLHIVNLRDLHLGTTLTAALIVVHLQDDQLNNLTVIPVDWASHGIKDEFCQVVDINLGPWEGKMKAVTNFFEKSAG